jgi:hypothetical protein
MKPTTFKESNKVLQKPDSMTDEECSPLEVFNDGQQSISCWQCQSFKERFKFLITGKMWLAVYSGRTQPPVYLTVDKPLN